MSISKNAKAITIAVNGNNLEHVEEFVYLGGLISHDGRCEADIKRRIGLTYAVFSKLSNIWNCRKLALAIKMKVFKAMVIPILMYGSECWTMRKQDEKRILVTEMSWLRKILGVSRLQHIRNDEIRERTGMEVTVIKKNKGQKTPVVWTCIKNGHVSRMDSNRIQYLSLHWATV